LAFTIGVGDLGSKFRCLGSAGPVSDVRSGGLLQLLYVNEGTSEMSLTRDEETTNQQLIELARCDGVRVEQARCVVAATHCAR
jgi:hypothetical protein